MRWEPMSEQQNPAPGDPQSSGAVPLTPLLADDPPKVGDFWLDARLVSAPSGVVFAGHDEANTPVMLILLSEGASNDAAARDRLAGVVNQLHIDTVVARGGHGQDEGHMAERPAKAHRALPPVGRRRPQVADCREPCARIRRRVRLQSACQSREHSDGLRAPGT